MDTAVIEKTRSRELEFLAQSMQFYGPDVIGLYGIAGVGKSTLLNQFATLYPSRCFKINCQQIEPTPRAFLQCLQQITMSDEASLSSISAALDAAAMPTQPVLLLDQFESINLIESWLRQECMPALLGRIRLIFCGRLLPANQWIINPSAELNYLSLKLECLSFNDSIRFLQAQGHSVSIALGINQFANGHPLALRLASNAVLERPQRQLSEQPPNNIIHSLVRFFIEDINDPELQQALLACSVIRRMTEPLLKAMLLCTHSQANKLYEDLAQIDFVEVNEDGLSLHEVLKQTLSSDLKSRSPQQFSVFRQRASQQIRTELESASLGQMWRYTADIIYLVENSVIRNAFFPPNDQREYSIEPACEADKPSVMAIITNHEPQQAISIYEHWWQKHINAFHCVKDTQGKIAGFYCLLKTTEILTHQLDEDPITKAWVTHLNETEAPDGNNAEHIFIRRWLSLDKGESLSGVQATCWLDIKRIYLEMRPQLKRVYLTLQDLQPYAPAALELGFQVLDIEVDIDGIPYYSAMLDMGEESVNGWVSKRLLHELSCQESIIARPSWFDVDARQIRTSHSQIDLTPLEFNTLSLLISHQEEVVSRKLLLKEVWGIEHNGSSNVVDTIIRSLRRKLGSNSTHIQSVRGTGYRFNVDA
ncbi:winged helix-turn-helix domain-containing protein [Vibrio breoganii]